MFKNKFKKTRLGMKIQMLKRYVRLGYIPNHSNPLTFNDKVRNIILNEESHAWMSQFVDKFAVRDYVESKIGEQYLINCFGSFSDVNDIDFSVLPSAFVIKTNFGTGNDHIEIVKDKNDIDINKLRSKFNLAMNDNWYLRSQEMYYSYVPRKIIIEELLIDNQLDEETPDDFKFHCFRQPNGEFETIIQVDRGRFGKHCRNIYNVDWELQPYNFGTELNFFRCQKPKNLEKMILLSNKLAANFSYARIDLYLIVDKIYFGEITLSHQGGFCNFVPKKYDRIWGDKIFLHNDC